MIVASCIQRWVQHSLAYNDLKIGNTLHPANPDIKRELEKLEKQNPGRATYNGCASGRKEK